MKYGFYGFLLEIYNLKRGAAAKKVEKYLKIPSHVIFFLHQFKKREKMDLRKHEDMGGRKKVRFIINVVSQHQRHRC